MDLIVRSSFDGLDVGARVTDPVLIAEILADHRAEFVTRVADAPVLVEPEAHTEGGQ